MDALFADHPQQPLDVVARRTPHGMHRITGLTSERTTIHAVIGLQLSDDGSDGCRRLSKRRSCSVSRLTLPRCLMLSVAVLALLEAIFHRVLKLQAALLGSVC